VLKEVKNNYDSEMKGLEDALGKELKARTDKLEKDRQLIGAAIERVTKKKQRQDVIAAFKTVADEERGGAGAGESKPEKKGGGDGEEKKTS
jgi:hypothetical protein